MGMKAVFFVALALAAVNGLDCSADCANGCTVYSVDCPKCFLPSDDTTPTCGESKVTKAECDKIVRFKSFIAKIPQVGTCPGNTDFKTFAETDDVDYTVFTLKTDFYTKG